MMRHRFLIAALGAMALIALLKRSPAEPDIRRVPIKSVAPVEETNSSAPPSLAAEATPAIPAVREDVAEQLFWDEIGGALASRLEVGTERCRRSILEKTAIHLGLEEAILEAASWQALTQIAQAWEARDESWLAVSSNGALDGDVRERMEREIHELYEARKREALSRFETVLGEGPRARGLRARLDEWIDAAR